MKDAHSFDLTAEDGRIAYNKMFVAYLKTFARLGLTAIPMGVAYRANWRRFKP